MNPQELSDEFTEFKVDVLNRFSNFNYLEEDNFKAVLKECIRSEEREKLLNKIYLSIVVFGVSIFLLALFVIWLLLFTTPI